MEDKIMNISMEEKYSLIKKNLLDEKGTNPIKIVKHLMHEEFVNIHGPEHHFLDGASFMVALNNAGLEFDLDRCLDELASRSMKMPGAMCGYWGVCGSVASLGAVFSIIDKTGPLSDDEYYKRHMEYTSNVIKYMSKIGGPRCCKRNAFISILEGVKYAKRYYGIELELEEVACEFTLFNKQCIKDRCPFYHKEKDCFNNKC